MLRVGKMGSIVESTADPLPTVKPKDYESFLQDHFNKHPTIKATKMIQALEGTMRVTAEIGVKDAIQKSLGISNKIVKESGKFQKLNQTLVDWKILLQI